MSVLKKNAFYHSIIRGVESDLSANAPNFQCKRYVLLAWSQSVGIDVDGSYIYMQTSHESV